MSAVPYGNINKKFTGDIYIHSTKKFLGNDKWDYRDRWDDVFMPTLEMQLVGPQEEDFKMSTMCGTATVDGVVSITEAMKMEQLSDYDKLVLQESGLENAVLLSNHKIFTKEDIFEAHAKRGFWKVKDS